MIGEIDSFAPFCVAVKKHFALLEILPKFVGKPSPDAIEVEFTIIE